jgi:hypothetical protein
MSTQATSSTGFGDDQYRQMQRMQLHDISESNELYEPDYHYQQQLQQQQQQQQQRSSPKESLMNLTQRVSNEDLKQAIRVEIKRLVTDYDRLVSVLQQRSEVLEQEYENLQLTEDSYQRRYEKAVREMQFFKKKYDKAAELNKQYAAINGGRPRSPSLDSNNSLYNNSLPSIPTSPPPSSVSGSSEGTIPIYQMPPPPLPNSPLPSMMQHSDSKGRQLSRSSSSSTTSSNASGTPYWTVYTSELSPAPPPLPRIRQNSNAAGVASSIHSSSTDGDSKNSVYLPGRKGSWQQMQSNGQAPASNPISPTMIPPQTGVARSATNASQAVHTNHSVIQQRKVDPIAFGGSDALWETIAKSKAADSTVEKMIRYFIVESLTL